MFYSNIFSNSQSFKNEHKAFFGFVDPRIHFGDPSDFEGGLSPKCILGISPIFILIGIIQKLNDQLPLDVLREKLYPSTPDTYLIV